MDHHQKKIAIVGLGTWGLKVLRMFESSLPDIEIRLVDVNSKLEVQSSKSLARYSVCTRVQDLEDINSINLFVVTTPAGQHQRVLNEISEVGGDAFVEKPFCANINAAELCKRNFETRALGLSVGHIFLYSERFFEFRKVFETFSKFERPFRYKSQRLDYGSFPPDVGSTEHLMYHDLYILDELVGLDHLSVTDFKEEKRGGTQNLWSRMELLDHLSGHTFCLEVSELNSVKVRQLEIESGDQSYLWNDVSPYNYVKSPLQRMMEAVLAQPKGRLHLEQSLRVKRFIESNRC